MRRTRLAALAFATVASVAPTADAGPPAAGPDGFTCGMSFTTNHNAEPFTKTGVVHGGPLAAQGQLRCVLHVDGWHGSALVSPTTAAPTYVPPTILSFTARPGAQARLCTEFRPVSGGTLYWHSSTPGNGHWSTLPSPCALAATNAAGDYYTVRAEHTDPTSAAVNLDDRYAGSGLTIAYADLGFALCDTVHRAGTGGVCLPFTGHAAVHVVDGVHGEDVPFQVCVDNNHDGFCGFNPMDPGASTGPCEDDLVLSHDDTGAFHNPVGPVPTGFRAGCAQPPGARSWNGYVVILCEGLHDTHHHPVTTGTAKVAGVPEGTGTFCGGSGGPFIGKPYAVI
jgi:hypothetical protein